VLSISEVNVRLGNLGLVVFLLFPRMLPAQTRDASATSPEAPFLWEFNTGGLVFSTPTVAGELLVAGSCNGRIRALDRKTGQMKWDYDIRKDGEQSQFHGDPLVTDDLVVIGTDGTIGHVYAFERATGAVQWKYKVEVTGVASDIVRLENQIYFVTIVNDLVCLDLQSGKQKWSFTTRIRPKSIA
jgi:outer membrane protein assembly factor BamB